VSFAVSSISALAIFKFYLISSRLLNIFQSDTSIYAKCSDTGSSNQHHSADGEEMLQVDRILGRRWNSRQIEFLTVWKGFPDPSEYTWEPEGNFSLKSLSIFRQMWGPDNDPPYDGEAEMLSEREIKEMKAIQDGVESKLTSIESKSSTAYSTSPSVRRSTRTRATVQKPVESESGDEKKQKTMEVGSTNVKSRSSNASEMAHSRNAAGVVWTPVNECILLLTALEHPEDIVADGPGEYFLVSVPTND